MRASVPGLLVCLAAQTAFAEGLPADADCTDHLRTGSHLVTRDSGSGISECSDEEAVVFVILKDPDRLAEWDPGIGHYDIIKSVSRRYGRLHGGWLTLESTTGHQYKIPYARAKSLDEAYEALESERNKSIDLQDCVEFTRIGDQIKASGQISTHYEISFRCGQFATPPLTTVLNEAELLDGGYTPIGEGAIETWYPSLD